METPIILFLGCCVTAGAVSDLRTGRIPNLLTLPMALTGLGYHTASAGLQGLGFSAAGLFLGIGFLFVLHLMGGMGAGDAKLLGAVGSIIGAKGVIIAGILSIFLGLVYAVILLLVHVDYARSSLRRAWMTAKTVFLAGHLIAIPPRTDERRPALRFALPIALGTFGYLALKITGSDFFQDLIGFHLSI